MLIRAVNLVLLCGLGRHLLDADVRASARGGARVTGGAVAPAEGFHILAEPEETGLPGSDAAGTGFLFDTGALLEEAAVGEDIRCARQIVEDAAQREQTDEDDLVGRARARVERWFAVRHQLGFGLRCLSTAPRPQWTAPRQELRQPLFPGACGGCVSSPSPGLLPARPTMVTREPSGRASERQGKDLLVGRLGSPRGDAHGKNVLKRQSKTKKRLIEIRPLPKNWWAT